MGCDRNPENLGEICDKVVSFHLESEFTILPPITVSNHKQVVQVVK